MDLPLREASASTSSPYRCYVRGPILHTEGDHVHTLGFKDGIAVVQYLDKGDKPGQSQAVDLTKLKKIIIKVDPVTGKKYIDKNGRKIELVPQVNSSLLALKSLPLPKLRVLDKYQVVRKGTPMLKVEREVQTEKEVKEAYTQTEAFLGWKDKDFHEDFYKFIFSDEKEMPQRKMIDPAKLQTMEEIQKWRFFNDLRGALEFDQSGNLPIHASVVQNDPKSLLKCCVVLKALRGSVNIVNQAGYAALHQALLYEADIEIIHILLRHGADVHQPDPEGNTAVHLAIEHRRPGILKILLKERGPNSNLDLFNHEGFTPLILACLNHYNDDVKLLLNCGADPNVKDMKSGRTALFHAAEGHNLSLVELLILHRADTKIRNFFGTSPHDAMFELEDMPQKIRVSILGRDHQRFQSKKKYDGRCDPTAKKQKLETTPMLKKVTTNDLMSKSRRK